jgi:Na+-driven multidrug efflux pump
MRGAGDTKVVMLLTWFSTYAIRLPAAWFFSGVDIPLWNGMVIPNPGPDWGLVGVWVGLCSELIVRALLFGGRFVQGGWRRIRV